MADSESPVLVQHARGVLTLRLNRPQALNSFNGAMHVALLQALRDGAADPSVRCLVITGEGRGFCAGQDLADPEIAPPAGQQAAPDVGNVIERRYRPLIAALQAFPAPVIAAVNGVAAGAGANLALNCDIVLAAKSASFLQAFSKIGLVPDVGGTWLLPRIVGRAKGLALAMLAEKLPAEEAERIGLIWRCVDDAALPAEAQALGERLAAMPTAALVATRHAFAAAQSLTLDAAIAMEGEVQAKLGRAHDFREGVAAFFAKRAPSFKDR